MLLLVFEIPPSASAVKTITTQTIMIANDLATRSRKLKVSAYNNKENAVIAIPAVRISLIVLTKSINPSW